MSFERFMKKNKAVKENAFYAATASLTDENGEPLKWEIKALTTRESEAIREKNTIEVPIPGKTGLYRPKVTKNYVPSLICKAVVFPDLNDVELQDSYGVHSAEELILEMIDNPTEYSDFVNFIQTFSGIDKNINDEIAEAKN